MQLSRLYGAHGVFPVEKKLSYANNGPESVNKEGNTKKEDDYHKLSAAAYAVTGILNNASGIPVSPELKASGNVYNSPAAMAKVALDFGKEVEINVQEAGLQVLSALYPNEKGRCEEVVGGSKVDAKAGDYSKPSGDQTNLVCVSVGGGGLHWVAQGSDGNFYDPGDGSLNNKWNPKNANDNMGGNYQFSGLWMVIS